MPIIKKLKFDLTHWLLIQRANYYGRKADKIISRLKASNENKRL